jgi:FdhD protein
VSERPGAQTPARIWRVADGQVRAGTDSLVTEEPLEVRLSAGGERRVLTVTMRTPGADFELAAGLLASEGLVRERADIRGIRYCVDRALGEQQRLNRVDVELAASTLPSWGGRTLVATSACGVCGKSSIEDVRAAGLRRVASELEVKAATLVRLPEALRAAQRLFDSTGGLHAAALFDAEGELVVVREDVGRHNAVDKVVGWALLNDALPLDRGIALVSGRAGFEIVQKLAAAGAPVICAVSAPSSLAVELARELGSTLVGFLRAERFNIYTHPERVRV